MTGLAGALLMRAPAISDVEFTFIQDDWTTRSGNMVSKKGRTTIRDVARLAEVAPITVSRVVNNSGYIRPETRRRVEQAIADLNYIPNTLSQSLRFQKTDMVALLVSDITNPFWTTVTRGVEDICSAYDLNVILCNTDEQNAKLENYVRFLLRRQTDGFLVVPTSHDIRAIEMIVSNGVPIVLLDRVLPGADVAVVRSDNESGAYRLTEHLISLGHRRIGMLSGNAPVSTSVERARGYERALVDHGISVDSELIQYGSFTQQSGYEMALRMLQSSQPRPTAFFAANNFIANGVQKAAYDSGLRIPEDLSLVTFDDLPFYSYPRPFLTSAIQNPYRLGQEAAKLLVQQIQSDDPARPQDIVLPVELIIRDSTAPPRQP